MVILISNNLKSYYEISERRSLLIERLNEYKSFFFKTLLMRIYSVEKLLISKF